MAAPHTDTRPMAFTIETVANSNLTLTNKGYGLCRDWDLDRHNRLVSNEYYAYYCPDATHSIQSVFGWITDTNGTVVLNPGSRTTIETTAGQVHLRGTGAHLVNTHSQHVTCKQYAGRV